jgi:O-antigen/teichoic acid export membrane protein
MLLKEYWHFNVKTFLSSSLKAGNQNIDNLILAYFLNTQIVGIYQVIKKILSPILIISSPFSMLVYPKLIHFFETKQKNMFQKIIVKISFYLSIIALLYITIIYSFLDHIFSFMDVQFINEYSIYYLLISLVVYLGSMMWWVRSFSNTVNPNYSLYMNLFATIFQMTITISMTHIYGFYGMINSILIMNLILLTYWITKVNSYVKKNI